MRKNLPNLLTLFNLLSGCLSIIFLFSGDAVLAAWMIGFAAAMDFLDGLLARLLNAASDLGKVLDSLADMVSFGVAPGLILFRMIQLWSNVPDTLAYIALLVPALSAVRLAIFSIDDRQKFHFIGVPTPLNALMLASIPLVNMQFAEGSFIRDLFTNPWFLSVLAVASSLLLVAPVRIIALKFRSFGLRGNEWAYILVLLFIILILGWGYLALPLIYVFYILVSLIEQKIHHNKT